MSAFFSSAPLILGAALASIWLVIVFVVLVSWLADRFIQKKTVSGLVMLVLLIVLPLGAVLLTRGFFRAAFPVGEDGIPVFLSSGINAVLGGAGDGSAPDAGDPAASSDAALSDANARKPEDYSDEELLALGEESFDDLFSMNLLYMNNYLIPTDYNDVIRIQYLHPDAGMLEWPYYRVDGYASLNEVVTVVEEIWYNKYARKYPLDLEGRYVAFNGAVYAAEASLAGPIMPLIMDRILSRTDDEVVFTGHWEYDDGQTFGVMEFSLVYEDGCWKYGYCRSVTDF
ncbi:MAG: hypothetical protein HDT27_09295 [Subdoligranulum sp.]|nr:hypothetical protein [Subdoligranulum sp.]